MHLRKAKTWLKTAIKSGFASIVSLAKSILASLVLASSPLAKSVLLESS